jgi:hypothetical protein
VVVERKYVVGERRSGIRDSRAAGVEERMDRIAGEKSCHEVVHPYPNQYLHSVSAHNRESDVWAAVVKPQIGGLQ